MKSYPTVAACAEAYAEQAAANGKSSHLSFIYRTAYSYDSAVARLHKEDGVLGTPDVLLTNENLVGFSRTTSRHIRTITHAFAVHSPTGRIISLTDIDDPLSPDCITSMMNDVDTNLHAAASPRRSLNVRLYNLSAAESRLNEVNFLYEHFDPFDTRFTPALTSRIYHTNQLFNNLGTRSHPCPLFSTHTQATVDALINLLAVRALEA